MADLYEEILKMKGEGRRGALATVIGTGGSTPREAGARLLVHEDGRIPGTIGGGAGEAAVRQEAMRTLREGKPGNFHFDLTGQNAVEAGMICEGGMHIYIEPVVPTPTADILGGGHIGVFVSRICSTVEFEVVVIDDRSEFANRERFPEAREVIAENFSLSFLGWRSTGPVL